MISKGKAEISVIRLGTKVISDVYYGLKLVYTAISSCFSRGWINALGWLNNDGWNS